MRFNKWWGLLVGLIISMIVGFLFMGGYTEGDNLVIKNLAGLAIILVGFAVGWWWESKNKGDSETKENK